MQTLNGVTETRHYLGGPAFVNALPESYHLGGGRVVWLPELDAVTGDPVPTLCLRQGIFALILGTYGKYEDAKFTWVEVTMKYEDKQIELLGLSYRVYYLLGTLIGVLIELGGQYNGKELPWWVGKRWGDLKSKILIPR